MAANPARTLIAALWAPLLLGTVANCVAADFRAVDDSHLQRRTSKELVEVGICITGSIIGVSSPDILSPDGASPYAEPNRPDAPMADAISQTLTAEAQIRLATAINKGESAALLCHAEALCDVGGDDAALVKPATETLDQPWGAWELTEVMLVWRTGGLGRGGSAQLQIRVVLKNQQGRTGRKDLNCTVLDGRATLIPLLPGTQGKEAVYLLLTMTEIREERFDGSQPPVRLSRRQKKVHVDWRAATPIPTDAEGKAHKHFLSDIPVVIGGVPPK